MFGLILLRRMRASYAVLLALRAPVGSNEALGRLRSALRICPGYEPALRAFRRNRGFTQGGVLFEVTLKFESSDGGAHGFMQVFEVQAESQERAVDMICDVLDVPLQAGQVVQS